VAPLKVGVDPTTAPEEEATVTLCSIEAELVKEIDTLPALAVSEVVSNFSWPSGLVARLSACPPLPPPAAGVEDVAELVVAGVAGEFVGLVVEELVLLAELPQPASASRPTVNVSTETFGRERIFRPAALNLTVGSSIGWGAIDLLVRADALNRSRAFSSRFVDLLAGGRQHVPAVPNMSEFLNVIPWSFGYRCLMWIDAAAPKSFPRLGYGSV
jgi:hypothetical protein